MYVSVIRGLERWLSGLVHLMNISLPFFLSINKLYNTILMTFSFPSNKQTKNNIRITVWKYYHIAVFLFSVIF